MAELKEILFGLGLNQVKTYVQSGNVVFRTESSESDALAEKITEAIQKRKSFAPHVFILTLQDLVKAIDANPFPEAEDEPKTLHLFFLTSRPDDPDIAKLKDLRIETERFELIDRVFYLHAPDGIGRSRLAASVGKAVGVKVTARNWRSVTKIRALAENLPA
jgi:uncharacterized protein (DUF1697 family)